MKRSEGGIARGEMPRSQKTKSQPDSKEMLKVTREIVGKRSTPASKCIKDKSGKTLFEEQQIAARWEAYIIELFEDDQPLKEFILETAETGHPS